MGKEIVYCEICGERILEQEFQKGRAITILNKNYCVKCKEEAVKNITMDDAFEEDPSSAPKKSTHSSAVMKSVRRDIPTRTPPRGTQKSDFRSGPSSEARSDAKSEVRGAPPAVKSSPKAARAAPPAGSKWPMIIGGVVGGAAIIILIILMLNSGKSGGEKPDDKVNSKGNIGKGETNKANPQKAAKAFHDLEENLKKPQFESDPQSALGMIMANQPSVAGSEFEAPLNELKKKYEAKLVAAKDSAEIDKILDEAKGVMATDSQFTRFGDIDTRIKDAMRKCDPNCRDRLPEVKKVWDDYKGKYEEAAQAQGKDIYDQAKVMQGERRFADAIRKIDTFPRQFRESNYWKRDLQGLRRECENP